MDPVIEVQMLNALEFFHYSSRFQERLFILALDGDINLENIVTDLRVLNAARIRCIVVAWNDERLEEKLNQWKRRGYPFGFSSFSTLHEFDQTEISTLISEYEGGAIPVIGLKDPELSARDGSRMDQFAMNLARHFTVDKVFFLSSYDGLCIDDGFVSHLTPHEAGNFLKGADEVNIGQDRFEFFIQNNLDYGFEIVLLRGESGCLFQEIFTHRGKGSLLTNDYPNVIRRGKVSDVMDIALLLRPYISSGAILPVSEDSIAGEVEAYYVYTVNNSVVAIAKLTDHGSAMELAKFCTLPRYQGKGRARELAERMINTVRQANKEFIFALSIEPKMTDFFISLGFSECDRGTLPESWQVKYDMSRPSKAFKLGVK
jgi:N-acetylglutamate synthase-like GNAT family acetyltransferase